MDNEPKPRRSGSRFIRQGRSPMVGSRHDSARLSRCGKACGRIASKDDGSPVVFVNRYDGIDLPGNSCRLLIMSGLPAGTSNYELFRASALFGGATITRMLAQRIEQ